MSPTSGVPQDEQRNPPVSALPSQLARALAFTAIVVGGLAGAVIGYGVAKVQCNGDCSAQKAGGSIIGALFIGIGIAIVAVLVLRAMGEWRKPITAGADEDDGGLLAGGHGARSAPAAA